MSHPSALTCTAAFPSQLTVVEMHCNYHLMLHSTATTTVFENKGFLEQVCCCYFLVNYTDPDQVVLGLATENTIHMMVLRRKPEKITFQENCLNIKQCL